jgi:hypothetical protein
MHKEEQVEELAKLGATKVKVAPLKVKAKQAKGLLKVTRAQRMHASEERAQLHRVATNFGEFEEPPGDEGAGGETSTKNGLFG